eukprot:9201533-Lingulodinium_polyedra.AAC.1
MSAAPRRGGRRATPDTVLVFSFDRQRSGSPSARCCDNALRLKSCCSVSPFRRGVERSVEHARASAGGG